MATTQLSEETFKELIFNYDTHQDWAYKGTLPAIIDFYADWCGPCKMVAPILEELSDEYAGKINIYKIDTEAQLELAQVFGIQSIPSFLFIDANGKPMMQAGAFPKSSFKKIIEEYLINPPQETTE